MAQFLIRHIPEALVLALEERAAANGLSTEVEHPPDPQRGHKERPQAEAEERLTELTKAPVASVPLEQDFPAANVLALPLSHSVHVCLYLALVQRLGTLVVTADT